MHWRRGLLVVASILTCGVSSAYAQREFEVTPFGGSRYGGVIELNAPTVDFLSIKSTWDYGVMVDVTIWPNLQGEFMWNRQPTELGAHDFFTGITLPVGNATLDMYQWGLLWAFRQPEAKLKPFVVGGVGFTHFDTGGTLSFSNRLSYNFGIGAKYFFSRHVGLRLEARYSPSRTTSSDVVFFDPFFGPFVSRVPNHAEQGQVNLGLIFRFK